MNGIGQADSNTAAITVGTGPVMAVDTPTQNASLGSSFSVTGWAIDQTASSGTGVDAIQVWATNAGSNAATFLGAATMGQHRTDIAAQFNDARFTSSGYTLTVSSLGAGTYTLTVYAHSAATGTFSQSKTVTVTITIPLPAMMIDAPATGTSIVQGTPFNVAGWSIDRAASNGAGDDAVHVWARNLSTNAATYLGSATYGSPRPDIASAYGSQFANSGYNLSSGGTALGAGTYRLTAFAHSAVSGTFNLSASVTVTVIAPTPSPAMAIDSPPSGSAQSQPFWLAGWAVDRGAPSGTGVAAINVWAFPVGGGPPQYLSQAAYGASRSDIGALYGSRFTNSGYSVFISGLAPGLYDITVYAYSTVTSSFGQYTSVRITVK
jgi:hypothetical protein